MFETLTGTRMAQDSSAYPFHVLVFHRMRRYCRGFACAIRCGMGMCAQTRLCVVVDRANHGRVNVVDHLINASGDAGCRPSESTLPVLAGHAHGCSGRPSRAGLAGLRSPIDPPQGWRGSGKAYARISRFGIWHSCGKSLDFKSVLCLHWIGTL